MKEKLLLLIALQECDTQLVKLSAKTVKLPEKIQKMEADFLAYKESVEVNKKRFDEIKSRHTECETGIKKLNEGMVKTRERLLEVKNNKEYQAMLKEIETSEKSRGEFEEKAITLLEEMESLSVMVKRDEETLEEARRKHESEKKIHEDDISAIDADTLVWKNKRDELQQSIPSDLLAQYEKVRKRNNGIGVIPVWKAVCNGCHMNIPPQLYNELQRSSELLSCPNCNRIMYYQNQDNPL